MFLTRAHLAHPAALLAAAVLCAAASPAEAEQVVDKIAAVVGTDIILLSEVRREAKPELKELDKASDGGRNELLVESRRSKIIGGTLDRMIDEALVRHEARTMKLKVTTEEVDRATANMAAENGVDVETFRAAIISQGMDPLVYRNKLRNQILRFKVLNLRVRGRVKIADSEARQFYNDQVRDVRATGTFEGAHILVRVAADARAAEAAKARKRAEEILARVSSGEDFAAVAREVSEDESTAKSGGSLGVQRPEDIPDTLRRSFLDLEKGELAGPVRTSAGYHVVRLNAREALGVQPFNTVKERIMAQLAQEEMVRQEKIWLKELRLRTFIDVRM